MKVSSVVVSIGVVYGIYSVMSKLNWNKATSCDCPVFGKFKKICVPMGYCSKCGEEILQSDKQVEDTSEIYICNQCGQSHELSEIVG